MGQRIKFNSIASYAREAALVTTTVVTSTGGAIASQTGAKDSGVTVAKTAGEAGRYTITADEKVARFAVVGINLIGAADAALSNTAGGSGACFARNKSPSARTLDIQFTRNSDTVDTEVTDGFSFDVTLVLYLA
jgi:hypothetical protein